MIKTSKFNKFIISLLLILVALLIRSTSSSYVYGSEYTFKDFDELYNSKEFYCNNHGVNFDGGTYVSDGNYVITSDDVSQSERTLAYILYYGAKTGQGGYNRNSPYQKAIWGMNDSPVYNAAINIQQIKYVAGEGTAKIDTGEFTIIDDVGTLYINSMTGKINKLKITLKNPATNETRTETIEEGSSGVPGLVNLYSDESCNSSINIENIKEKSNVYFKLLNNNYEVINIKINVHVEASGYKVFYSTWKRKDGKTDRQNLIRMDGYNEGHSSDQETEIKAVYPTGKLRIVKVDKHFNEVCLGGAQFKIHSKIGWVVKLTDGTIIYTGSESEATEFATSKENNGQLEVVLRYGKYDIYETKAPIGYDITKQDGYMNNNGKDPFSFSQNNKWVYTGRADIYANTLDNNVLKYTVTNKKVVDRIRGRVWVDNPDTKANNYNNILDENGNDKLIAGIKVTLFDQNNKEVAVTTTDANGYYEFTSKNSPNYTGEDKNLYYWELAGSYVEFTYDNKTYVVVDPFVGNNLKVNSKAMEYKMTVDELEDEKLTGTEGNLAGKAITYRGISLTPGQILANNDDSNKNLKTTPLTGYYNNETYTVDDINLGIKEKRNPEYTVSETLEYIKVKMKGYTYTYKYGEDPATLSTFVPKVAEQNSKATFTAAMYPTDIAYNIAENTDEMKVYVVYSIGVKNNETTNIDDIYAEQRLYLNSLTNNYDTNRYELSTTENNSDSSDFALWSGNNGTASYDVNNSNSVYKDGMAPQETKTAYIQFRVKEDALRKMLTRTLTEDDIESAPTVAKASAYHEYLRTDNVWIDDANVIAFNGVKGTGYPRTNASNEKYYVHKSVSKNATSSDLYIKLTLSESRKLSGIVFEDSVVDKTLGNGTLDDGENNRASKVTVELLNADKQTVSKLYQVNDRAVVYDNNNELPKASLSTTEGGTYTFDGVVPGYYYIRFTYGDGKQLMMPASEAIKSKDYKSTIITNENIKNAMEAKDSNEAIKLAEWYKTTGNTNYSTAVDDLNQRRTVDGYVYKDDGKVYDKDGKETTDIMNINAYTPMIGISIENDIKNATEGNTGTAHKNEFKGFNFGLIKQPDTNIAIEKKITNVKFTNQAGTTLVSENPSQSNYITALDKISNGSKNAKMEIEPEQIYGSNIEITYEITVTNNSVEDYTDETYYKYGKITDGNAKRVYVQEVNDNLDPKYNYNSLPQDTVQTITTEKNESKTSGKVNLDPVIETINNNGTSTEKKYIKTTGWESLARGESTTITYTATALIGNNEEDPLYRNSVKLKAIKIDALATLNTKSAELDHWASDRTVFTVMPTTGENRSETYFVIGAIALAIISAGLILIKKKVL